MGLKVGKGERLDDAQHIFTHRVWKMKSWKYTAREMEAAAGRRLVDRKGLDEVMIPTAFRAYRQAAGELLKSMEKETEEELKR